MFRSWGFKSEIFSETKSILPELRSDSLDVTRLASMVGKDDVVLLHFSIGSDVNEYLAPLPCRRVLRYHNITPHKYFAGVNTATFACLRRGREQLKQLSTVADANVADSAYNALELEQCGYRNVSVLPIIMDRGLLEAEPDRHMTAKLSNTGTNILFVGRCAPNKCIEELVTQFYYYYRFYDKKASLIHVGSFQGTERYYYFVRSLIKSFGIAERVRLLGSVPQSQLNAYYKSCDLFVSMSDHEGFCIPVIEAMYHRLPVVAFASSAVPDTMDGAGVLFAEKNFALVAETMHHIVSSAPLREAILKKQDARITRYFARDFEKEMRDILLPS